MTNRLEQLIQALPPQWDGALITSDVNRRYFTGFASSAGALLVLRGAAYFLIDSRYEEAARAAVTGCEVILQKKLYDQLADLLMKHNAQSLALESDHVTLRRYLTLEDRLAGVRLGMDNHLSDAIEKLRRCKSAQEIAAIQAAQNIADQTFTHILNFIAPGRTEREIELEMITHARRLGSEGEAFPFIVLAGRNTSVPHGVPTNNPVAPGDFVLMDFGCVCGGYNSDMTRTVAVGEPTHRQRQAYATVLEAQGLALEKIRPGVPCSQVDQAARDHIDASPFKGAFGHSLGHSLGLEVHENPNFTPGCPTPLEPGFVLSVEPGVYLPGAFGVRIEDIIAVTETGCHNFTASPKELICL